MDAGGNFTSAAKGLAKDLEVAGSKPVSCHFFIPFSFLLCGSLACLSVLFIFVHLTHSSRLLYIPVSDCAYTPWILHDLLHSTQLYGMTEMLWTVLG